MDFQDRKIDCEDCQRPFNFSGGEQAFYKSKGYPDPKRCKTCREIRKEKRERDSRK